MSSSSTSNVISASEHTAAESMSGATEHVGIGAEKHVGIGAENRRECFQRWQMVVDTAGNVCTTL